MLVDVTQTVLHGFPYNRRGPWAVVVAVGEPTGYGGELDIEASALTPNEARALAQRILAAADDAERRERETTAATPRK